MLLKMKPDVLIALRQRCRTCSCDAWGPRGSECMRRRDASPSQLPTVDVDVIHQRMLDSDQALANDDHNLANDIQNQVCEVVGNVVWLFPEEQQEQARQANARLSSASQSVTEDPCQSAEDTLDGRNSDPKEADAPSFGHSPDRSTGTLSGYRCLIRHLQHALHDLCPLSSHVYDSLRSRGSLRETQHIHHDDRASRTP